MSDNNTETKRELNQDEKVQFLKAMFSTLDVEQKAVFANWCHEQIELGAGAVASEKLQKSGEILNKIVSEGYDKFVGAMKFAYEKTNEAFETRDEDAIKNNTSEELDKDDSPSFFS